MYKRKSLTEKIYQQIRNDITFGKYYPGEHLVEDNLVQKFKASRSPIREALRQLQSEGLVEKNKGIRIAKLSIQQVDEIYSLRWLLESYAARLTSEKFKKKDSRYLRDLQHKLTLAAKNLNLKDWLQNNTLFHEFLIKNCGNSNLIQVLDTLKRRVYRYHYITVNIPGHFQTYLSHHEEKYMKLHLQIIKDILITYLREMLPNY